MFLSKKELAELTGRTHRKKQMEWLLVRGWPFELSANFTPKVLRSVAIARLGGSIDNQSPTLHLTDEAA